MTKAKLDHLIVFTRHPEAGRVKTRLIPSLGAEGAARFHRRMTELTLARANELLQHRPVSLEVRYEGGDERLMEEWLGLDLEYRPQGEGDLGQRMARAFSDAFRQGATHVVIIGTDCPGLSAEVMEEAFEVLVQNDLVLGPSKDGGYYLIGLARLIPQLFIDIPWGTGRVLRRTKKTAKKLGCRFSLLNLLTDIDRPKDLKVLEEEGDAELFSSRNISIIMPTLNEGQNVGRALERVVNIPDVEVIVIDGGSTDETVEIARSHGARVIITERRIARQMNAGAQTANGDLLMFMHADTLVPKGFEDHVREILAHPSVAVGAFTFRVDEQRLGLRIIEWLANFRSRRLKMPYCDQAIFVRKELFQDVGGFPDLPIMEDYALMQRLKRRGRVVTSSVSAITSARRWKKMGLFRTTFINQLVIIGYHLGISPSRLEMWYRGKGGDAD
jgi:rSAM/selenodomain-associated transferase 2/rSAM/selenodomain-associated transferase 1